MIGIFSKLFGKQKSISTSELDNLLKQEKVTLIDVRTAQEYRSGHIQEAKNLPLNQIVNYSGPKTKPVYVICQSGMRSKRACAILNDKGYQTINVKGGMSQWTGRKTNPKK